MALMLILRYFFEKKAFSLLAPPKQMSFLTSSHENVFFSKLKAQDCLIGRDSCIQQKSAVAPDHFVDAPRI